MNKIQGWTVSKICFAVLGFSLIAAGIAPAQVNIPVVTAKFSLSSPVQWNRTVLQPGDYTVSIGAIGTPTSALVRDSSGRPVAQFMTGIVDGTASTSNTLLIAEKGGQLRVFALALASLGRVLVYDPALAREAVLESRVPKAMPVILAKR